MPTYQFVRKFVLVAAVMASIFFFLMLYFFFSNLETTTSQYSAGGVSAPFQLFHNFMHGRPFQTSLFASEGAGQSVGFSYNPYAYLHIYAIHLYLTPFLFAPLWNLFPNLTWLYGLVMLVNYCAMAIFTWKTLKHLSPHTATIKTIFALAILLASGFLFTFQQNAQLLLFGGPFILAAYYFLLTRRRAMFTLSMALLCLISEDAAMVAVTFSAYVYIFERDVRSYAVRSGLFAVSYLAIVLLVIQPASRSHLVLTDLNTAAVVVKLISSLDPSMVRGLLIGLFPALFFIPAFGMIYLLFGKPGASWPQLGGVALIAPLPHWGESALVGASHHLLPVIDFMFIAFVLALGRTPEIQKVGNDLPRRKIVLLFVLVLIFLAGSLRIMISNLPEQILLPLYSYTGQEEKAKKMRVGVGERNGNRQIIEVVERIPPENSLVYLTNTSVEGFISGRSDIWRFPNYYDRADYLVIQPGAHQSFFSFPLAAGQDVSAAIAAGKSVESADVEISRESAMAIVRHLVEGERSHRVVVDAPGVVLLERINKQAMDSHPSTLGWGWVSNVFHSRKEAPGAGRRP